MARRRSLWDHTAQLIAAWTGEYVHPFREKPKPIKLSPKASMAIFKAKARSVHGG